jgi:hypothetical protein
MVQRMAQTKDYMMLAIRLREHVWIQVPNTLLRVLQGLDRRKNRCVLAMGLVTVLNPLRMTGAGKLVFQTVGETRLVVDSKMKPVALVGQVKMTLVPERMMVSCVVLTAPNERPNTVPKPKRPTPAVAPCRLQLLGQIGMRASSMEYKETGRS